MSEIDDLEEDFEPPEESEQQLPVPHRIILCLTAIDDGEIDDLIESVIAEAEDRGFVLEWGTHHEMDLSEVPVGSPLDRVLRMWEQRP
jgi:hypothetical protein